MAKLEELTPGASLNGILPDALVSIVSVPWRGTEALELTYKTSTGKVANELLFRADESRLELAGKGRPWSLDGDGPLFRLVSAQVIFAAEDAFGPPMRTAAFIFTRITYEAGGVATRSKRHGR